MTKPQTLSEKMAWAIRNFGVPEHAWHNETRDCSTFYPREHLLFAEDGLLPRNSQISVTRSLSHESAEALCDLLGNSAKQGLHIVRKPALFVQRFWHDERLNPDGMEQRLRVNPDTWEVKPIP